MLPAGIKAPDFELYATPDQWVRLSELKGQTDLFSLLSRCLRLPFGKHKIKQVEFSF